MAERKIRKALGRAHTHATFINYQHSISRVIQPREAVSHSDDVSDSVVEWL